MKQDIKAWSGILVYVECYQGTIHPVSLELIGEASRLARRSGEDIYAIAIGEHTTSIKQALAGYPLKKVFLCEASDEYLPMLYERIMVQCIETLMPAVVLLGGTYEGRTIAPRLAVSFRTGLTADCTSLGIDEKGNLVQTRPAFGGDVMASILTQESRPQFATVRPQVMERVEPVFDVETAYEMIPVPQFSEAVQIKAVKPAEATADLAGQRLLVVAGRGVKKKEDLQMLRELAELLGGKLACSRALVELGYLPPQDQIGLSGSTVSPEYMITCGVSGTVQFMAGMKRTKNIIAINSDPQARIFEIAHYPICGDLYEIVPKLIACLKQKEQ